MIRINLLREPKASARRKIPAHLGRTIAIIAGVAVLAAGGGAVWKFRAALIPKPRKAETADYTVNKESAPSTYAQHDVVEDVVKEVSDANQKLTKSGMLSLSYEELSFAEKINYEILFAKNIADLLARCVPSGIGLRSLEVENFQTLYMVGLGPNRDLIQTMVASLKNERVEILPPPYSFIKPNDGKSFKFAFSCKPAFGLNLTEAVIDAPFPPQADQPSQVSDFEQYAHESGIVLSAKPKLVSPEKVGGYYRMCYQWSGNGTYKNFVKLITRLYQANAKCCFKRISLIALTGANLKIESQIIFTTRQ